MSESRLISAGAAPALEPLQQSPHVRLTHIDGLRGLAAVSVMISHYLETMGRLMPASSWRTSIDALLFGPFCLGRLGVVAFFCVSGFVIPFSFPRQAPLRGFVISRLFRLYPAYWLAVCGAVIVAPLLDQHFTAIQFAANLTMIQWPLGHADMSGVFWTLRVEVAFYVICALLFMSGRLHNARVQFAALLGFMMLAHMIGAMHVLKPGLHASNAMPTYLAVMHFGTLCRLVYLERDAAARALLVPAAAILLLANVSANLLGYVGLHLVVDVTGAITGYTAGVLLFLACVHYRLFRQRPLLWLGSISYSLYLFHGYFLPVVPLATSVLGVGWPAFVLSAMALVGLAFGASWLIYHYVERRGVRWGRQVAARFGGRRSAGVDADHRAPTAG